MHSNFTRHWQLITAVALIIAIIQLAWAPPVSAAQSGDSLLSNSDAPLPAPDMEVRVERSGEVELGWSAVPGAAGYNLYRSTTQGTGYKLIHNKEQVEHATKYDYLDKGLTDRTLYYYVIKTVNGSGVESITFDEVEVMPHREIPWVGTTRVDGMGGVRDLTYTISDTLTKINGEVFIQDHTVKNPTPIQDQEHVWAQFGYGPADEPPSEWTTWSDAQYLGHGAYGEDDPDDRYQASFFPTQSGEFLFGYRFTTSKGRYWIYGGDTILDNPDEVAPPDGNLGTATVLAAVGDEIPPAMPQNFKATVSDRIVKLSWDANTEPDLYAYKLIRNHPETGEQVVYWVYKDKLTFEDKDLLSGTQYTYELYAVDQELLFSFPAELKGEDAPTTVSKPVVVTINLTVPPFTPGTVYLSIQNLDGTWNTPVAMNKNGNVWTKTLESQPPIEEGTRLTLYFHRSKAATKLADMQKTGQALADGNTSAPLTTFTVVGTNEQMVVNRILANWLDPLPVKLVPDDNASGISPYQPISITWNQPMPENTCFQIINQSQLIPGSCAYQPDSYTTVFELKTYMPAMTKLNGKASGQVDSVGHSQQSEFTWSFEIGPYNMYLPAIQK